MSNGAGGLYGGLEPLPDIDAVLRGVATGSGRGDEKPPPKPGAWDYSPIDLDEWFRPTDSPDSMWGMPSPYSSPGFDEEEYRRLLSRRGLDEPPTDPLPPLPELNLPRTRTTAPKEPKCDTCAQALAAADSLGTEAAIRCLWAAASRTSDTRGRPLTHGLYSGDSDRKGLLDELRQRCTPGADNEETPAKDDRRTTSVPLKPQPEDRPRWPPWGDAQNDLLPGRRSKLRYPPTARSCGQKKPADRFELEQAQQRPWAQGWFPCPPDGDRLDENSEAYLWWFALPTWRDRGIADSQVAALQEALEDCVESVRKRALEPVTTFRTMEDAHRLFPSVIEDIRREAAEWGTASLRNMRTLSIFMLFGIPSLSNIVGGEWFETMSRDQVVDEYERRADKFEGVTGLYIRPTHPGYQEALREALDFVDGERAYDEALFEANYRYKALGEALKCRALYRLWDRARIGNEADALLKGVLDDRHRALRRTIRGAETRYELGAAVCELGHRLCCALLRC